ncbi:MAG: nicotinate (nicotinamide) nucleotide adenylyltransferase [Desulforhopalus sp.]
MTGRKIGLLGGTFDPVHLGHLQFAESALNECQLNKVVFIPSAQPPHKTHTTVSSFKHRLAMVTLAGEGVTGFDYNAIERSLPKPSYTIDTLRALNQYYEGDCCLYFMIGADAFLDILTWKSYQEILCSVHILLSERKGYKRSRLNNLLKKLGYKASDNLWRGKDGQKDIYILRNTPEDHSSSIIRAMVSRGESVHRFLPKPVIEYIQKNKLYQFEKPVPAGCGH